MKDKLIYIYPHKASFVANDILFLEKKYTVVTQDLDWGNAIKLPFNFLKQLIFLLINLNKTTSIIINFGGYFSLLPTMAGKLFSIKTYIILNGTDCVSFPTYNYGSLRKSTLKFAIKKSCQMATKLMPVNDSLIFQNHSFDSNVINKKQGIKAFFPNLKTTIKVIPNGFDTSFWKYNKRIAKNGFITVAVVSNMNTFKVKGIDLIIKAAENFPNERFTIIGISKEIINILVSVPKNVILLSFIEKEKLIEEYQKNLFYLQLSVNEGFGCSLSEAMLCGCIPIVSNVGALPQFVNSKDFIVKKRENKELISVLEKALRLKAEQRLKLSETSNIKILNNFDSSLREKLILQEIEN
jgi:glycosyltransferase involved in cell wall biosynthesis